MKKALDIFIEGLEKADNCTYINRVILDNMSKPAYKKMTIELYRLEDAQKPVLIESVNSIFKITSDKEKEDAFNSLTVQLITAIIKSLKYEVV